MRGSNGDEQRYLDQCYWMDMAEPARTKEVQDIVDRIEGYRNDPNVGRELILLRCDHYVGDVPAPVAQGGMWPSSQKPKQIKEALRPQPLERCFNPDWMTAERDRERQMRVEDRMSSDVQLGVQRMDMDEVEVVTTKIEGYSTPMAKAQQASGGPVPGGGDLSKAVFGPIRVLSVQGNMGFMVDGRVYEPGYRAPPGTEVELPPGVKFYPGTGFTRSSPAPAPPPSAPGAEPLEKKSRAGDSADPM